MIDQVEVKIKAGDGGDGLVSFRHERFIAKGGPDGGDGGRGGSVYFIANPQETTLSFFNTRKVFQADNGAPGGRNKRTGKSGEDLILPLPIGSVVYELDQKRGKTRLIDDLVEPERKIIIAKGGRGGRGNTHFATATQQTPIIAQVGFPGQEKLLKIELKLIAEIGLIGLPNSGKSTLLSRLTKARPKIAPYPFTTLEPNLGVLKVDHRSIVMADIPGLIEGASKGKGLGDQFLRHIERTKILVHLIDVFSSDLENDFHTIQKELELWNPQLLYKKQIVVLTKIDALTDWQKVHRKFIKNHHPLALSAVSGQGLEELVKIFVKKLE
jgi:GTP-binding protein